MTTKVTKADALKAKMISDGKTNVSLGDYKLTPEQELKAAEALNNMIKQTLEKKLANQDNFSNDKTESNGKSFKM